MVDNFQLNVGLQRAYRLNGMRMVKCLNKETLRGIKLMGFGKHGVKLAKKNMNEILVLQKIIKCKELKMLVNQK